MMPTPGQIICADVIRALKTKVRKPGVDRWQWDPAFLLSPKEVVQLGRIARRHGQCIDRLGRIRRGPSKARFLAARDHFLSASDETGCSNFNGKVCASIRALANRTRRRIALIVGESVDTQPATSSLHIHPDIAFAEIEA